MRTQTKDTQHHLTPRLAWQILVEGNRRFINNLRFNRNLLQQVNETSDNQYPFAIILSCIDSRTSAELVFDQGLGDIFSVRIAGNVLNEDILGSMEYACQVAGSKLIVILGHTRCGAVTGACSHIEMGHLTGLLEKIQPSVDRIKDRHGDTLSKSDQVEAVAVENVLHSMNEVVDRSSILRHLLNDGRIGLVGAIYNVETGEIRSVKEILADLPVTVAPAPAPALARAV